ncbi:MAG: aldo/keto reductase [Desulfobacterales bacterium]|nr:aldo/keto reductase [Desulfobacterales bacterium]
MKLQRLGSTDLRVSAMGVGMAALGRPGYINIGHGDDLERNYHVADMERRAHNVLDAAWNRGVRYFDAARSYGRAEAFLGSWLRDRGDLADTVVIGSKWGYTYKADWQVAAHAHEVKDHSLPVLRRQWAESLATLGRRPDLYQIHSATLESGVLENTPVLGELARIKGDGVVIGLSVSGPRQREVIERALSLKVDGIGLFDCVQATWNLLERSAEPALALAAGKGVGVIVKEGLANGRLTERNISPEFEPKLASLNRIARRLETSVDALALAAVLARPWAGVVLSGAACVEHLASNLTAVETVLDDAAVSALEELTELPETYWQIRSKLAWN